ncbi:hypothetical protein [Bosea psychrotolerans]|uniref:Uncharacterized protein n=1 Tax=Bosea psychrotolerans TaxID=1871628 RepID=A0A2S4M6M1_9HYPH|nr:hypothetical protein [Bosea psychrotolerans]POR50301.1 hypothetical protein CYD53_1098 [Bosea psychrotolerans]
MLISFLQDDASAKGLACKGLAWRGELGTPPFWELEELIAQGHDTGTALEIIAVRRSEAEGQDRPPACDAASPARIPA